MDVFETSRDSLLDDPSDSEDNLFNLAVSVVEGRNYAWQNIQTQLCVQFGSHKQYGQVHGIAERPYYDEYFVFDFTGQFSALLGMPLVISLFHIKTMFVKKKQFLASARFDLANIWLQPGHQIPQKWIVLTNPNEPAGGIKGYLKVDIGIIPPGVPILKATTPRARVKSPARENFAPESTSGGKMTAQYIVKIFRGTGVKYDMKLTGKQGKKVKIDKRNMFVRVYFAGLSGDTTTRTSIHDPVWNEEIIFTEAFPPMYSQLRIDLYIGGQKVWTRYINVFKISDPAIKGFSPTFGPTFLHMYNPTHQYIGSLLVAVVTRSTPRFVTDEKMVAMKRQSTPQLDESLFWSEEEFVVFSMVSDINMIDQSLGDDGEEITVSMLWGDNDFAPVDPTTNRYELSNLKICETKGFYNYVETTNDKPTLFIKKVLPDTRHRGFLSNALDRLTLNFKEGLINAQGFSTSSPKLANKTLRAAVNSFVRDSGKITNSVLQAFTELQKERIKIIRIKLAQANTILGGRSFKTLPFPFKLKIAVKTYRTILKIAKDPQDGFPLLVFTLKNDSGIVGHTRLPLRDIVFSTDPFEKGAFCGRIQSLYFKNDDSRTKIMAKLDIFLWFGLYKSVGFALRELPQGFTDLSHLTSLPLSIKYQISTNFVFRAHLYRAHFEPCDDSEGFCDSFATVVMKNKFGTTKKISKSVSPLWSETINLSNIVLFGEPTYYEQFPPLAIIEIWNSGRKLIGSLYVLPYVYATSKSLPSHYPPPLKWYHVTKESTIAGELLAMFELVQFQGNWSACTQNGCFAASPTTKTNLCFMGATSCLKLRKITNPGLKLEKSDHNVNSWFLEETSRANSFTGIDSTMANVLASPKIPEYLRPKTVTYRMEVLFWGLRQGSAGSSLKSIKNPKIVVTCGDTQIASQVMQNMSQLPNFIEAPVFTVIEIPDNPLFCPPVIIRLYNNGYYGTSTCVGSHVIRNIHQYTVNFDYKKQWKNISNTRVVTTLTACYDSIHVEWDDESDVEESLSLIKTDIYTILNNVRSEETKLAQSLSTDRPRLPRRPAWFELESRGLWAAVKRRFLPRRGGRVPTVTVSQLLGVDESAEDDDGAFSVRISRKQYLASDPNWNPLHFDWWTKYYESVDLILESEDRDVAQLFSISEDEKAQVGKTSKRALQKIVKDKRIRLGAIVEIGFEGKEKLKQKCRGFPCCCRALRARKRKAKKRLFRNLFDDSELNRRRTSSLEIHDCELEQLEEYEHFQDTIRGFNIYKNSHYRKELEDKAILAEFKGGLCIYKWQENRYVNRRGRAAELGYYAGIPKTLSSDNDGAVHLLARVYAVKAHHLHSRGHSTNPYIDLETNSATISDREGCISHQNNPLFAKFYEINAILPFDSILRVKIMNKDKISDELIGETVIDIENRFYSRHRGTCGLPQEYNEEGYNRWRDIHPPSQILETLCRDFNLPSPRYKGASVSVGQLSFSSKRTDYDFRECLALSALRNWHKIPIVGCVLVREHVETRTLFNNSEPGIEQGKLEMWLDLFPIDASTPAPPPIDITPRIPDEYELRVVVVSTRGVALKDPTYFHGMHVDIFVKGWIGKADAQKTDVHFNSLDGVGLFNWRFIFNFHHFRDDEMIIPIAKKKKKKMNPLSDKDKIPPVLHLQLWDNEKFSSNDFLGSLEFNLHQIPKPTTKIFGTTLRGTGTPIDLFHRKVLKGTWEFMGLEDDSGTKSLNRAGLVSLELELLTKHEAEANPAGLAREGPNALTEPKRVKVKFGLAQCIMNPIKKVFSNIMKRHKGKIVLGIVIAAFVAFFVIFIYSIPGALSSRFFNPSH